MPVDLSTATATSPVASSTANDGLRRPLRASFKDGTPISEDGERRPGIDSSLSDAAQHTASARTHELVAGGIRPALRCSLPIPSEAGKKATRTVKTRRRWRSFQVIEREPEAVARAFAQRDVA
jgi:hypothetical protein